MQYLTKMKKNTFMRHLLFARQSTDRSGYLELEAVPSLFKKKDEKPGRKTKTSAAAASAHAVSAVSANAKDIPPPSKIPRLSTPKSSKVQEKVTATPGSKRPHPTDDDTLTHAEGIKETVHTDILYTLNRKFPIFLLQFKLIEILIYCT